MRERIISCSTELFGSLGIKGLTMGGIATELGISKRTLYEHFGCKEELLYECLRLHLNNSKLFSPKAERLIDELLELYAIMRNINLLNAHRFCRELQKFYDPAYKMLLDQLHDYASICGKKVESGINDGYICRDINQSVVRRAVSSYLTRLLVDIGASSNNIRMILSPEIILIFTRGLCTIKGLDYMDKKLKEFAL